ncbi:hypothetical protein [Parasutterella excrementihominis]|uniref:hypothetical protein n=1 Tax=Parasutterella excrementihominis TaxID=487175 RepID=UPI00266D91DC|nr:hypothetical protein [Parasutterella excrementihominis]
MLKQLIQLLVNQLVPKRAVSGGGSKLIYGKEAEQFGLPVWPSPTVINLPDEPEKSPTYVATTPCLVCLYVENTVGSVDHIGLSAGGNFITLIRRSAFNGAVYIYAKKGDTVIASYKGTTAQLRIYPLVLPT